AQAASGDLGSFLGGTDTDVTRARPLIATYSADIAHFGAAGQGHTVKLLNNFLTVGLRQLVVQSIQAARRHDVDLAQFVRLAQKGAAGSRILEQFGACALDGDYTRNKFSIGNCRKDMAYAGDLLSGDDDAIALQQALLGAYERLVAAGHGDRLASEMLDPNL
ncbi:MAG: NAD-binding protein, partial [Pseudomonadota bacterium]